MSGSASHSLDVWPTVRRTMERFLVLARCFWRLPGFGPGRDGEGVYLSSFIAARTRAAVWLLTPGEELMTRGTGAVETPARRATLWMFLRCVAVEIPLAHDPRG